MRRYTCSECFGRVGAPHNIRRCPLLGRGTTGRGVGPGVCACGKAITAQSRQCRACWAEGLRGTRTERVAGRLA